MRTVQRSGVENIRHIAAVLPNTGEHFVKNPMFKFFGTGQFAVDNQPVQVSLGDVGERLGDAGGKGVAFHDTLTVPLQSGTGIGISQGRCRITGTEQIHLIVPLTGVAETCAMFKFVPTLV